MRHTLLPLHERKSLRLEYRVRVIIVACFMLSLAGLVGIAAIFPVYIKGAIEKRNQEEQLAFVKKGNVDAGLVSLQQSVARSQALLDLISKDKDSVDLSSIVASVIGLRQDIKLTSISVTRVGTSSISTVIQGKAPTRDSLLSFKKRYESAKPGNAVELPVSELAKSANIQFSLSLTQQLP